MSSHCIKHILSILLFLVLLSCTKRNTMNFSNHPRQATCIVLGEIDSSNSTLQNLVLEKKEKNQSNKTSNLINRQQIIQEKLGKNKLIEIIAIDSVLAKKCFKIDCVKNSSKRKGNLLFILAMIFWCLAALVLLFLAFILLTIIMLAPGPITGFSNELNKFIAYSLLTSLVLGVIGCIPFLIHKI